MVLSWYEQKAVCILLTLLHLGIKGIYLGPTLPAFVSPGVLQVLVDNYGIRPISTPEADLAQIMGLAGRSFPFGRDSFVGGTATCVAAFVPASKIALVVCAAAQLFASRAAVVA